MLWIAGGDEQQQAASTPAINREGGVKLQLGCTAVNRHNWETIWDTEPAISAALLELLQRGQARLEMLESQGASENDLTRSWRITRGWRFPSGLHLDVIAGRLHPSSPNPYDNCHGSPPWPMATWSPGRRTCQVDALLVEAGHRCEPAISGLHHVT